LPLEPHAAPDTVATAAHTTATQCEKGRVFRPSDCLTGPPPSPKADRQRAWDPTEKCT
jgi:hypothetical protein